MKANLINSLFIDFELQLREHGYIAEKGQIVDASFVEAPRQRNTREENATIKSGKTPESFEGNPAKKRQKDVDARWTEKNNQSHYGYKNHISIDNKNKLIRGYEVTSAEVHDSNVLLEVLAENTSPKVYADSAYKSEENDRRLTAAGYDNQIHERAYQNTPLTTSQIASNKRK